MADYNEIVAFTKGVGVRPVSFTSTDGTTAKQIYAPADPASRINFMAISSTAATQHYILLQLHNSSSGDIAPLGVITVPSGAGTNGSVSVVSGLNRGNLPWLQIVDSELTRLKIDYLDYAKIDTEGFDLKVLKGAQNSIRNKRIGFIQFEYNRVWSMSGSTLLEAYEILEESGYKIYLLKPDGLYNYDVRKYGEFYAFSNFLAIAPHNLTSLKSIIKGAA